MADSIDESDVQRVDRSIDPTATDRSSIEQDLPDTFEGDAQSAFAERVSEMREPVRDEAQDLLSDRLSRNGSSVQLRNSQGQFAPGVDRIVGSAEVSESGSVSVDVRQDDGDLATVDLGRVDLQAGAEGGSRAANPEW